MVFSKQTLLLVGIYLLVTNNNLFAQNNTFISCKISHQQFNKILFSGKDDVIKDNEWTQEYALSGENNSVLHGLSLTEANMVRITYDARYFEIYVEPGDTLSLSFDGEIYPSDIIFTGKKSCVNHNLYLHEFYKFSLPYSNKNVVNKMCVSMPLEFRSWINTGTEKKWSFLRQYDTEKQQLFNPSFANFIRNDINYWSAYYLMRYSSEHESLLSGQRFYIPNAYFDFLNEILINNDEAFSSVWYRNFLVEYWEFRRENIDFIYGLPSRQLIVKTNMPSTLMYSTVDAAQTIATFSQDSKLLLLDKLSYTESGNVPMAYRLKVKSSDGLVGWIKTAGVSINESKNFNSNPLYIENIETNINLDQIKGQILFNTLKVYGDQDDDETEALYTLPKNESLSFLNITSDVFRSYHDEDRFYSAPLTKICCDKGTIGWVSTSGLRINWKRVVLSQQKSVAQANCLTLFNNLDYFFSGKALYYLAAIDIRERIGFEGKKAVEKNIAHYIANCPDIKMVQAVNEIFTKGEKRFFIDSTSVKVEKRILSSRSTSINAAPTAFRLANNDVVLNKNKTISAKKTDTPDSISFRPIVFPEVKYNILPAIFTGKNSILKEKNVQIMVFPDLIHYNNRLAVPQITKAKKRKDDIFRMEIPLVETIYGFLKIDKDSIPIFLQSEDEVEFALNPKKELVFQGKNAINLAYFQAAHQNNKRFLDKKVSNAYKLSPSAFQTALLNIKKEKISFLTRFKEYGKLNRAFKTLIERDIDYFYSYHLLNFATKKGLDTELPKSFLESMEEIGLQSDQSLPSEYYRKFITQYADYKLNKQKNDGLPTVEIIRSNFSGKTEKYLEARFLSENPATINNETNLEFAQFVSDNPYPIINEMLKTTYKSSTASKTGSEINDFELYKTNGKKVNLSDYKGKIVHIEFWNVQCSKWLKDSELRNKRQAEFDGKKVTFLYINVGENTSSWKKSCKLVSSKGVHLSPIQNTLYDSRMDEVLGVQSLPASIVLDTKGRIFLNAKDTENEEAVMTKIRTALLQL